ncbi:fam-a protein [Plasmodium yoelii yoelii]|uniref:Fam-a protein n=1 Tax=Plasmodium yoelii yoelii TaxID=73239 RepID=A0AAE9WYT9_PLAYO|nr:fam-a protein [Plasmodium yoelii yoelii]
MNKFCVQIVLFLLSISVCVNTKSIVAKPDPKKATESKSTKFYPTNDTSEEIYEKNKHLLCTNPEETMQAEKLMNEAVTHLEYHATSKDYKLCKKYNFHHAFFYKKKHQNHTDVEKIQYTIDDPDKYNEVINDLWNSDSVKLLIVGPAKITRVYNPNLVMIQQRYKKKFGRRQKYFYALAKKIEISKDKTIIVMTSVNVIDQNPSNKKYKNTIIENANLFKTTIDSEDDIRKGELKKTFLNIAGYIIEKRKKYVDITYVESIDCHVTSYLKRIIRKSLYGFSSHK